ncbi:MAG: zf-HC2 domain-containing protein [Natronosporangium sp.]
MRDSLGAYVLGALETEEEAPMRIHLVRCPACRAERDDLAGVARLLRAAMPIPAAAHGARPPHPPPTDRTAP